MSEPMKYPKRYSPFYTLRNGDTGLATFGVEPRDDGIYVEHSDYWKLFEEVVRLKAEVERMTKAVKWQPISTAPKDGTDILIAYRDGYFGCMSVALTCWGETSWRHLFSNEYITDTPTCWMPIPLAPANEENNKL
jgi:hypothetical protein